MDVKLVDVLLIVAVGCLACAVALWSLPAGLVVAAVGFVGLWWLLDDEVQL